MLKKKKLLLTSLILVILLSTTSASYYLIQSNILLSQDQPAYNWTYDNIVDLHPLIVHGKIIKIESEILDIQSIEVDSSKSAEEFKIITQKIPKSKLTIDVMDILKDEIGVDSQFVFVYDDRDGVGEDSDGEIVSYVFVDGIKHELGDEGIFFIHNYGSSYLKINDIASYYLIDNHPTYTTSQHTKLFHGIDNNFQPIKLDEAKKFIRGVQ